MRLQSFNRATLEYAQLQYRHSWTSFDKRVSILAGDLRKIGLFPALAAIAMSAGTLLGENSNVYLCVPLILAGSFYLIAFFALAQRERSDQVIALLEYAVSHTHDPLELSHAQNMDRPKVTLLERIRRLWQ